MQAISKVEGRISCIPNNKRSTSPSLWVSSASSTEPSSCWHPLTSWWRPVSRRPSKQRTGTSPAVKGESFCCAKACTNTSTWTPGPKLCPPPPRKPSSASFQTSTSVRMTTPMRKGCGGLSGVATWGTTTTSATAQTCPSWQMSSRPSGRPACNSTA